MLLFNLLGARRHRLRAIFTPELPFPGNLLMRRPWPHGLPPSAMFANPLKISASIAWSRHLPVAEAPLVIVGPSLPGAQQPEVASFRSRRFDGLWAAGDRTSCISDRKCRYRAVLH